MVRTDWIWNFLLGFFAPKIAVDIGPLILLIFFGALVFGWFYVYLLIPETKGLSLEEVRFLFPSFSHCFFFPISTFLSSSFVEDRV